MKTIALTFLAAALLLVAALVGGAVFALAPKAQAADPVRVDIRSVEARADAAQRKMFFTVGFAHGRGLLTTNDVNRLLGAESPFIK